MADYNSRWTGVQIDQAVEDVGTLRTDLDGLTPEDIGAAPSSHTHAYSTITGKPSSFTPSSHASSHMTGGTDALTPDGIGALSLDGGKMTGALTLFGAPTETLHAATKGYVDGLIGDIGTVLDAINGEVV